MHMNGRQFVVFICDAMGCLGIFCLAMAHEPLIPWIVIGKFALTAALGIMFYFGFNFLFDIASGKYGN